LWCEPVPGSKHARLQLPGMSLHLISVLVHATKEVTTTVHVEHDSSALRTLTLLLIIV
jgi:hypothetical protein